MKPFAKFLFLFFALTAPLLGDESLVAADKTPPSQKTDEKQVVEMHQEDQESSVHDATESYEMAFVKTIVVLVGLLVLVLLTIWMFKKISHGRLRSFNYMKSIKILEKRPLSPKSMLYLVEVGGKQVLLAESQLHVKQITSIDYTAESADL